MASNYDAYLETGLVLLLVPGCTFEGRIVEAKIAEKSFDDGETTRLIATLKVVPVKLLEGSAGEGVTEDNISACVQNLDIFISEPDEQARFNRFLAGGGAKSSAPLAALREVVERQETLYCRYDVRRDANGEVKTREDGSEIAAIIKYGWDKSAIEPKSKGSRNRRAGRGR